MFFNVMFHNILLRVKIRIIIIDRMFVLGTQYFKIQNFNIVYLIQTFYIIIWVLRVTEYRSRGLRSFSVYAY